MGMELSVIVAVFNCEKYLAACLQSLERQSVKYGVEFISVDDGSRDGSWKILETYKKRDSRFKIFTKLNGGLSSARNYGLESASGRYVCFVDGDDKVGASSQTTGSELQNLLNEFDDDVSCVVGNIDVVYEANKHAMRSDEKYYRLPWVGHHQLLADDLLKLHVSAWGKIYRRSFIDAYNLLFPEGMYYEDAYWHMCYAKVAPRFKFCRETFYTYYRHPTGIMNDTFNKKVGLKAFDHVRIAGEVYKFYKKTGNLEEYQSVLEQMFEAYFKFAMSHVTEYDRLYVIWGTGKLLRELDFDTSGSPLLSSLKDGGYGKFLIKLAIKQMLRKKFPRRHS